MKILLIGEYSNLHNSLKHGLICRGHTVKLISSGDGFKNFKSDLKIKKPNLKKRDRAPIEKALTKEGLP